MSRCPAGLDTIYEAALYIQCKYVICKLLLRRLDCQRGAPKRRNDVAEGRVSCFLEQFFSGHIYDVFLHSSGTRFHLLRSLNTI